MVSKLLLDTDTSLTLFDCSFISLSTDEVALELSNPPPPPPDTSLPKDHRVQVRGGLGEPAYMELSLIRLLVQIG